VGLGGIEPPTSPLSGVRSSQLSYRPLLPPYAWWSWSGSNRRPPECKSGALPAELQPLLAVAFRFRSQLRAEPIAENGKPTAVFFRGQLDAETKGPALGRFRRIPVFQVEMPGRAPRSRRNGNRGLEWNGCLLLGPVYTQRVRFSETPPTFSLRKEVIQPQVLLRLPCYDFTPIMNHTLGRCPPCGSACGLLVQSTFVM
jgi:hypothetical protein